MHAGAPETEGDFGRRMAEHIEALQRTICAAIEAEDGGAHQQRIDVDEAPGDAVDEQLDEREDAEQRDQGQSGPRCSRIRIGH